MGFRIDYMMCVSLHAIVPCPGPPESQIPGSVLWLSTIGSTHTCQMRLTLAGAQNRLPRAQSYLTEFAI